ncbi:hypothetical protein CC85DRAFT_82526 [Cutaneotrichosporon oleaginosum]|uniref:Uncharacterized protein n=1 Tax=Cutaneotrichosporon oleaginosum TaxID=879819 RepID=A0A0J0XN11_9TREE|nr:uncharacterized protein CC85DRAFT_82526 [Cutaneotrichosporon oleaginosum]KLT42505.1 hypothetical protein CC85DRAFT_82526 [Cutaneotrichosporon oleaginosum]TXT07778.1 hypothetical protein COLE_04702 [Cutaneotrichosporon oleaginosum]
MTCRVLLLECVQVSHIRTDLKLGLIRYHAQNTSAATDFDVNNPPSHTTTTTTTMSAILVHASSLSLATPSTSTPISLPSRFPRAPPRSTSAPSGNVFIWADARLWEYDALGRRKGELALPVPPAAVAADARALAVALPDEVRVFRRAGKGAARWGLAHTLAVPRVTAMRAGGGVLVLCAAEVQAYAIESGIRIDVPDVEVTMPVRAVAVADSEVPAILIPSSAGLVRVVRDGVTHLPLPLPGIIDVAVSGDTVAAVGGDMLALNSEIVGLGHEAAGVTFLSSGTVAVWTTAGNVLLVDVETREIAEAPYTGVLAMHPAPMAAPEKTRHRGTALGERTNVPKKVGFDKRTVSAPDPPSVASTARIRPAHDPDQTISTVAATPLASRAPPTLVFVEDDAASSATSSATGGPGWDALEELRREIGDMQMDMLRMGRSLKNEIRAAVAPLVEELRMSRETIAAQAAEIERLRRGY